MRAFTTLRHGAGLSATPFDSFNLGTRCDDDPQAVAANREELVRHFALPSAPRWLRQVHGTAVLAEPADDEPNADAAVTATPGVVLAILTADCLPVLFCAQDGSTVGIAHAGWRGLAAGVLENTIVSMRTAPEKLLAWLGPAAGPDAYEVGVDVRDAFGSRDRVAEAMFIPTRPSHWQVNLYGLAILRLMDGGMPRMSIYGGDLCTISDPQRFYSYRRDGQTGRMASVIFLREGASGA